MIKKLFQTIGQIPQVATKVSREVGDRLYHLNDALKVTFSSNIPPQQYFEAIENLIVHIDEQGELREVPCSERRPDTFSLVPKYFSKYGFKLNTFPEGTFPPKRVKIEAKNIQKNFTKERFMQFPNSGLEIQLKHQKAFTQTLIINGCDVLDFYLFENLKGINLTPIKNPHSGARYTAIYNPFNGEWGVPLVNSTGKTLMDKLDIISENP